ncbi:MAG: hypothetical protein ACXWPM_12005 [Bdellovibrionota bacterium]
MQPRPYAEFKPLYPPRPKFAVNPEELERFPGYLAQYKYNDIRVTIYRLPDGEVEILKRDLTGQRQFRLLEHQIQALRRLPLAKGAFHVLDGGILRPTQRDGSHPILLWDILVHDGTYLLGTRYETRYKLLAAICGNPASYETVSGRRLGLLVAPGLWLAPVFQEGLRHRFLTMIDRDEIEGLILKDPGGKLEPGYGVENNGSWQIRVRKPREDYTF